VVSGIGGQFAPEYALMTDNRASSMAKPSMHFDESYLRWFRGIRRNRVFPEFVEWNGVGIVHRDCPQQRVQRPVQRQIRGADFWLAGSWEGSFGSGPLIGRRSLGVPGWRSVARRFGNAGK